MPVKTLCFDSKHTIFPHTHIQPITFIKHPDVDEKKEFAKKLAKYKVSLQQYVKAFGEEELCKYAILLSVTFRGRNILCHNNSIIPLMQLSL